MNSTTETNFPKTTGWKGMVPERIKRPARHLWKTVVNLGAPKPYVYFGHRTREIERILGDTQILDDFATKRELPTGFGRGFDERVVEFPWLLSRLKDTSVKTLDIGSTLNHRFILEQKRLAAREITVVTLEPEDVCFWQKRISYIYCDARALPFRDEWFDEVVSISALEHVGLDNTRFYSQRSAFNQSDRRAWITAIGEMWRVLRPGGVCFLTMPFGRKMEYGWFQQFDSTMVDEIMVMLKPANFSETYFRYVGTGWELADRLACSDSLSFHDDPRAGQQDVPKAAGAVVALELTKPI